MNHLMHLYLVDPFPEARLGALFGDYVKGPLDRQFPVGVRYGITHHRRLDSFAETAPAFRRSKKRLAPALRHCKGILIDIVYDHFLATQWDTYHHQPLEDFATSIYDLLQTHRELLPRRLKESLPRMLASDWLVALRSLDHVEAVLQRLASRLSHPNLLGEGKRELLRNRHGLLTDFTAFMSDVRFFSPRRPLYNRQRA